MSYTGAAAAAQSRELLGMVLETLQRDRNIPPDVLAVSENIARAIGALFEAERASSDRDGRSSVRHAMGSLSQTMALLQDVRTRHDGIDTATRTLAEVMSRLYPLGQASLRPSMAPGGRGPSLPGGAPVPQQRVSSVPPGSREKLEANVGATTESNFFVGFSGDISEGGVFVATYLTLDVGDKVEVLVTLPGGFEKTIPGTVRFVRDPMDMDADPGIGVRFDRLDEDARELILRFIRKRPPLFYDE